MLLSQLGNILSMVVSCLVCNSTSRHGDDLCSSCFYEALCYEPEDTSLQGKLNYVANVIAVASSIGGVLLFLGLIIRFFVQIGTGEPPMCVWR